ncbi:MAG: hypothetical protein GKR99_08200 [Rhodobacteraceae bacterium]|nr:hypothetical protein [Paracoccaceae bacterium]
MTQQNSIVATLSFEGPVAFDSCALREELGGLFRDVDLDLVACQGTSNALTFAGSDMLVDVARADDAITVSVSAAGDGNALPERAGQSRRAACYNVVRLLQARLVPESVHWSDSDMATAAAKSRRRQLKKQREDRNGLSPKERMNQIFGTVEGEGAQVDCVSLAVPRSLTNPDAAALAATPARPATDDLEQLGYRGPHARLTAEEASRFPDLMPAEIALREERRSLFACDAIELTQSSVQDETTNPTERVEADDIMARLTVYVLNTILLVLAFPVGFGMLIFNILGGENLRTTAHVMALTGMGTALAAANIDLPLIHLI